MSLPAPASPPVTENEEPKPFSWSATIKWVALGIAVSMMVIFGIGLYFAFSNAEVNAPRIQVIREVLSSILILLSITIVTSLAVFILQIIHLVSTIRHETAPILETTQETVTQVKGTVEFVGQQVAKPIITVSAWGAAISSIIGDLGGIRRAFKKEKSTMEHIEKEGD
jgi:hypothetical protein